MRCVVELTEAEDQTLQQLSVNHKQRDVRTRGAGGQCRISETVGLDDALKKRDSLYHGHRFPPSIISLAVRWYFRFQLSLRDIEELLFERGVVVNHESIRRWTDKFGAGDGQYLASR